MVPEPDENTNPVFGFQGEIDGALINLMADGTHKAYSTFGIDSLGVSVYEGWLAACEACPPRFHFRWRASSKESPDLVATTVNANPKIRQINRNDSATIYEITLVAETFDDVSNYSWRIMGEQYAGESVVLKLEEDVKTTKFPVQLDVNYSNGCFASIIDTVYLPNHGCDCKMNIAEINPLLHRYTALATGGATYAYEWQFENGEVIPSKEITYQFAQFPGDGVEEITLGVNTGDCKAYRKRQQFFDDANVGCAVNFDYNIETRKELYNQSPGEDLGQVSISYLAANGMLYNSEIAEQTAASFLRVLSTSAYLDPFQDNGEESIMVDASFQCELSNGQETITLKNASFILPIGKGALQ
jgi:hypothetical protein